MSEEILKALMELFALVVKQDGGIIQKERDYVISFLEKQLGSNLLIKYILFFDDLTGSIKQADEKPENSTPSLRDSVKILNICKQINRTLNKGQKIVVCLRDKTQAPKYPLVEKNTVMFVMLHEMAHLMTETIGHTQEFWNNFKRILHDAVKLNIYTPVNYAQKPTPYCGMVISDSPI